MPAYQYVCKDCEQTTEQVRGIRDSAPDLFCKTCNIRLKRVYSNVGVAFKGSGFYKTDNQRG